MAKIFLQWTQFLSTSHIDHFDRCTDCLRNGFWMLPASTTAKMVNRLWKSSMWKENHSLITWNTSKPAWTTKSNEQKCCIRLLKRHSCSCATKFWLKSIWKPLMLNSRLESHFLFWKRISAVDYPMTLIRNSLVHLIWQIYLDRVRLDEMELMCSLAIQSDPVVKRLNTIFEEHVLKEGHNEMEKCMNEAFKVWFWT